MLKDVIEKIFLAHYPENEEIEEQNIIELENALSQVFNRKIKFDINSISNSSKEHILNDVLENAIKIYEEKEQYIGTELMRKVEKYVLLRMIDSNWKDHLYAMDDLKEGIGLRAYGQQDPLMAYQVEGHDLFDNMMARIEDDTVKTILRIEIQKEETKQNKKEEEKPKEDNQETSISKEERQKRRQLEKKLKKKRKL
jgi:preprotein translocase subunit SecA